MGMSHGTSPHLYLMQWGYVDRCNFGKGMLKSMLGKAAEDAKLGEAAKMIDPRNLGP